MPCLKYKITFVHLKIVLTHVIKKTRLTLGISNQISFIGLVSRKGTAKWYTRKGSVGMRVKAGSYVQRKLVARVAE